ncbi:MAG: hypothetical protein JWM76_1466, partial [Pseudonocardiales bacterium]|nr:hypothetical protein [Pseudonocardiales bacterium]
SPDHGADAQPLRPDPVVGVVMTSYNSESYIEEALESLRAQTFSDWECVVVDDGSSDSTTEIVSKLVASDSRITLVLAKHGGVSVARNIGLNSLSPGPRYVAFFDSDDVYLPDGLELLVAGLDARPDAVGVYGLAEYIDENGTKVRPGEHSRLQSARRTTTGGRGLADLEPGVDSTFSDISVIGAIWPSAVGLHRRSSIDAIGGFDPTFTRQGDWEFYVRMSRQGPYPVVNRQVAWYRRHSDNLTGNVIESCYQQDRVRDKAWKATENTAMQRQQVAKAARRLQLADGRRMTHQFMGHVSRREVKPALSDVVSLGLIALPLLSPGPARPSRRRLHWTKRNVTDARPPI